MYYNAFLFIIAVVCQRTRISMKKLILKSQGILTCVLLFHHSVPEAFREAIFCIGRTGLPVFASLC